MQFDTESMFDRRADNRWDRTCVGDVLERLTYSRPDKTAIVGWSGAYSAPEFASLTYRQADEMANRVAQVLLAAGVGRGERCLLICENSVEAYVAKIGAANALENGIEPLDLRDVPHLREQAQKRAHASREIRILRIENANGRGVHAAATSCSNRTSGRMM